MDHPMPAESDASANPPATSAQDARPLLVDNRRPLYLSRHFQQICTALVAESLTGEDLTPLQWTALACIERQPGIDQRSLAEALGIVAVNAGQLADQLEAMALIDRR